MFRHPGPPCQPCHGLQTVQFVIEHSNELVYRPWLLVKSEVNMRAVIQRFGYGGDKELWSGEVPVAPRADDFICINADDASLIVARVEWDYTTQPIPLCIIVH